MVSNDIVVPLLLQRRATRVGEANNAGARLLVTRRIAIFVILFLAYAYYRSAGDAQLASIGLLSFAAISQLAPAFFGGLIWRRGTARGAIAGMTAGVLVWAYTLLLPSIFDAGAGGAEILTDGPWGLAFPAAAGAVRPRPAAAGARRCCSALPAISSAISAFRSVAPPRRSNRYKPIYSSPRHSRRCWSRGRRASGCAAPRSVPAN